MIMVPSVVLRLESNDQFYLCSLHLNRTAIYAIFSDLPASFLCRHRLLNKFNRIISV